MPKIKEVPSSEVHWQVSNWNVRDAANTRIKQYLGADAQYFAPVYVTHSSYYWSDSDADGWVKLPNANDDDTRRARAMIEELRSRALRKAGPRAAVIEQVFCFPNDDFIFVRRREGGELELRLTGWGFANYKRGSAATIIDTTVQQKINEITLSFTIDGKPVPRRKFSLLQGTAWVEQETGDDGIYSFGRLPQGSHIAVRDLDTGVERIVDVDENTGHIDVDVTQFVVVRITARHDGEPVGAETVTVNYGHRQLPLALDKGVTTCSLPWLEGVECDVVLRGEHQRRELRREAVNDFNFDFSTPHIPHTRVEVFVGGDGAPIAGESVAMKVGNQDVNLVTDASGMAVYEYDLTPDKGTVAAGVRGRSEAKNAVDGTVRFDFVFDTPPAVPFTATVRVVNLSMEPLAGYPVLVDLGDGNGRGAFLTDANGTVGPFNVLSGNKMQVWDGNDEKNNTVFDLVAEQQEYIFVLPYESTPNLADILVRVKLLNNQPAAGVTAIMAKGNVRITDVLDAKGETAVGSDVFTAPGEMSVDLYSSARPFPHIPVPLEKDEKEYELVEVAGPQPWWHVAGEIALAAGGLVALTAGYFALRSVLISIPCIF